MVALPVLNYHVFRHRVNANRRILVLWISQLSEGFANLKLNLTNVIGVTGTVAKEIAAK
jgi:hypothetical protein